jgi:predicted ATPase
LPAPEQVAAAPAVRLFVERAVAVDPGLALTDGNADTVAAIFHRLDGLPLALALAATRSPHLPPATLLSRLARRLPLLTGGPRDVPARLQTMRDAIAWSHDLLSPAEQVLFRRFAVFAGGFTLEAAEAVSRETGEGTREQNGLSPSDSVLDLLASLVDKSLVRRIDGGADARTPRFEMLETVREFGLEWLEGSGEASDVRAAHAAFYLALADEAAPSGGDESARFDRLETELANFGLPSPGRARATPRTPLSGWRRIWHASGSGPDSSGKDATG